ncbi:MAG TPA: hypothetical protein V6D29_24070 [Leptolyngbyaceae cyanobacterium]
MPMQRELYPSNWDAIALAKKEAADWTCEDCRRPCRKPGEDWNEFLLRAWNPSFDHLYPVHDEEGNEKPQRFTLTVAHLDQDPSNNDPSNHRALCAPCHLAHDRPHRLANSRRKRERAGQLNLLQTNHNPS